MFLFVIVDMWHLCHFCFCHFIILFNGCVVIQMLLGGLEIASL